MEDVPLHPTGDFRSVGGSTSEPCHEIRLGRAATGLHAAIQEASNPVPRGPRSLEPSDLAILKGYPYCMQVKMGENSMNAQGKELNQFHFRPCCGLKFRTTPRGP